MPIMSHTAGMLSVDKVEKEMNQNFEMAICQYCEAPTLDKTFTQEDCENCGYWLVYSTGESSNGTYTSS